jgi:glycosyltransferase involved in cell wall biosynthesis
MAVELIRIRVLAKRSHSYLRRRGLIAFTKRAIFELRMRSISGYPESDENVIKFLESQDLFLQSWEATKPKRPEVLKFSIIVPVYKSNINLLEILVNSIINQTYRNWELLLVDDGSLQLPLTKFLDSLAKSDNRIIALALKENQGISAATNLGLEKATGDFICLADHDDVIHVSSLSIFANQLSESPNAAWIYSDEAKISADSKKIYDLFFKPDWSPYYLKTCMYTAHFAAYRTDLMKELKFRALYDGAQDYDFALRLSRKVETLKLSVLHVPLIFYFWRAIPGSTALSMDEKPESSNTALSLLNDFRSEDSIINYFQKSPYQGAYCAIPNLESSPISVVIPTALKTVNKKLLLKNCIDSLEKNGLPPESEIIIITSKNVKPPEIQSIFNIVWLEDSNVDVNIARKMNLGAGRARYRKLAFINDDIEFFENGTLQLLAGYLDDVTVGTAAPKLIYPEKGIQCAGVALNVNGLPDHIARNFSMADPGYYFSLVGQREVTANTGACILITKSNFDLVHGFDELFPINYNDIDLCLKLNSRKLVNLQISHTRAIHLESASRVPNVEASEEQLFLARWKSLHETFYPIHLQSQPPNYSLVGFNSIVFSKTLKME